jgi:hypothetical protein
VDARGAEDDVVEIAGRGIGDIVVERQALLVQRAERSLVLRERPVSGAHALPGRPCVDLHVNGQRVLAQGVPDPRAGDRPTTEGDHRRLAAPKRVEGDGPLEHPELELPPPREQLGNRLVCAFLELAVEVEELAAEPASDLDPERRLAGAHEADERQVPV